MTECLGSVPRAVARIGEMHGNGIAEEVGFGDGPFAAGAVDVEQAFAGADQQAITHGWSFRLAAGQRLDDEDLIRVVHRIGEVIAIGDLVGVDVDRDVAADAALVIKDVGTKARVRGEDIVQHGAYAVTRCGLHRGVEMALEVGGECHANHAPWWREVGCPAKCCGGGSCLSLNFSVYRKATAVWRALSVHGRSSLQGDHSNADVASVAPWTNASKMRPSRGGV